ncbi:MAG: amidohydrolase family protein [Desulfobacterales bacterium]
MVNNPPEQSYTRREFLDRSLKTAAALAVSTAVPGLGVGCGRGGHGDLDVVIKNATIFDGTSAEPFVADIGIQKDRIVSLGGIDSPASTVIQASGKVVTPGFIDVHTHCDLTFQKSGLKRYLAYIMPSWKGNYNYVYQGVTTVVTGNCGYGYTDVDQWLNLADSVGFGTNLYTLVPHGMIREALFGVKQPEELNGRQLNAMEKRVAEEMEKGAVGLSTGLEYAPGYLARTDELIALAGVVRKYGGIFTSHMRDESGRGYPDGRAGVIRSIDEMIEIGRRADIPVQISHLKISLPINRLSSEDVLERIEGARRQGVELHADQYPYAAGSTLLSHLLPNEMKTSSGIKEEFRTGDGKRRMIRAMDSVFSIYPPEKTMITMHSENESYEGKTLKEIAEIEQTTPARCYADMVCEKTLPIAVYFFQDMNIVRELMPHDYIMTASDGWTVPMGMSLPHPRVYGTFPKKLNQFVRNEKLMSFKKAIRSMTSLPAEKFRMKGRGKIETGAYADIVVWDKSGIKDDATYSDPHHYSEGVEWLLVNGVIAIENKKATRNRGGRALRVGSV